MAKRSDNFNEVYKSIQKNAKKAAISAAKQVAKKVAQDMHKQALKNLEIYYANYDPDVYERTYNLKNAIRSYYKDASTVANVSIEIGVVYDASYLASYRSNSWYHQNGDSWVSRKSDAFNWDGQDNGAPDPEWILDNFLHGIHPKTTTGYEYAPVTDPKSQIQMMEEFIDNKIPALMDAYMNKVLIREFTKRMA